MTELDRKICIVQGSRQGGRPYWTAKRIVDSSQMWLLPGVSVGGRREKCAFWIRSRSFGRVGRKGVVILKAHDVLDVAVVLLLHDSRFQMGAKFL